MSNVGDRPCNATSKNSASIPNFSTTTKTITHGAHESYQPLAVCQHHRIVPPTCDSTNGSAEATSCAKQVDQPRTIVCAGDNTSTVPTLAGAHRRRAPSRVAAKALKSRIASQSDSREFRSFPNVRGDPLERGHRAGGGALPRTARLPPPMLIRLPPHLTSLLLGHANTANGTVAEVDADADMGPGSGARRPPHPCGGTARMHSSARRIFQAGPGETCETSAGQACAIFADL